MKKLLFIIIILYTLQAAYSQDVYYSQVTGSRNGETVHQTTSRPVTAPGQALSSAGSHQVAKDAAAMIKMFCVLYDDQKKFTNDIKTIDNISFDTAASRRESIAKCEEILLEVMSDNLVRGYELDKQERLGKSATVTNDEKDFLYNETKKGAASLREACSAAASALYSTKGGTLKVEFVQYDVSLTVIIPK